MPFAYEPIPADALPHVQRARTLLGWRHLGSNWLIDRERDVALIMASWDPQGYDGPPGKLALLWNGQVIPFNTYTFGGPIVEERAREGRPVVHVIENTIRIPEDLESKAVEVKALIQEAVRAEQLASPLNTDVLVRFVKLKRFGQGF